MIYLTSPPYGGEPDQPHPPELKFLIWPSSRRDQQKSILGYKLSFLWKFQPDLPTLRGGLNWSGILWHPRYLHSLNLHFGLDMYFWENTLPNFTLVATPVAENMVSSLRLALIEKIPAYPDAAPEAIFTASWSPYHINDPTGTADVILKPMQSDLECVRWFSGQISWLQTNIWYWFGLIYMYLWPI